MPIQVVAKIRHECIENHTLEERKGKKFHCLHVLPIQVASELSCDVSDRCEYVQYTYTCHHMLVSGVAQIELGKARMAMCLRSAG